MDGAISETSAFPDGPGQDPIQRVWVKWGSQRISDENQNSPPGIREIILKAKGFCVGNGANVVREMFRQIGLPFDPLRQVFGQHASSRMM